MAEINGIFIAAKAGQPMRPIACAQLESGKGIVGDRYHTGIGAFSKKLESIGKDDWQITLIESEEIESFLASAQMPFGPGDFRRNMIKKASASTRWLEKHSFWMTAWCA
jgi:hypothetical protein